MALISMELKKNTKTALFVLPIITTFGLNSLAYAEEEPGHNHEVQTDEAQTETVQEDPSAVTLDAMIISSEQSPEDFESIKLI